MKTNVCRCLAGAPVYALLLLIPLPCFGQAVDVTVRIEPNLLYVGESTVLRAYGQVLPAITNEADRIFSWYVDLINGDGSVAQAQYCCVAVTNADNFPATSSSGTTDGFHRRGIHDTFMGLAGAGMNEPVELFNVPVTAVSTGVVTFSVAPGTTVTNLTHDFQVARKGGGAAFTGGVYTAASADLYVLGPFEADVRTVAGGNEISFPAAAGLESTVQYRDDIMAGPGWADLPGGPHNSGVVTDQVSTVSRRYYRVKVTSP
jgi:hypothetical protein